ncbi:MAG: ATP-binding protein [Thiohalorhabdus sp.]
MGENRSSLSSRLLSRYSFDPGENPSPAEVESRLKQQAVVAELGEMGLRGASLEILFDEAVAVLAEVLDVELTKVLKLLPGEGALLVSGVGWREGLVGEAVVPTGRGSQAGYTLLYEEPVIAADLRTEERFTGPDLLHEHGVISGMSVVIQGHDGPYGVLGVHSRRERQFTQYDVNFVKGVANVLGATIQRAATEAALRRSEATFREIFNHAGVGIAVLDLQGNILEANPAYAEITGYSQEELNGGALSVRELIHPEDWPSAEVAMARLRDGEVHDCSVEKRLRRKDGGNAWIQATVTLRPGDTGHPRQFIALLEDITKRRQAEETLAEASRRKDEFLSMLAHELRNPLTPIATMGEVLASQREPLDPERLRRMAATIQRQSAHLTRIVDDLLDLNRIKTGRIDLRKEIVDLRVVADQAAESVAEAARENGQSLELDLPEGPLATEGDPVRLAQILTNLLDNAVKYSDPGGAVRLTGFRDNGQVVIRVRDTGQGIPPERLPRLFDDFDRGGLRSSGPKGLGLGLAVVRRLVELHGGRVEAWSPGPGQGSEFTVHLPVAELETTEQPGEAEPVSREGVHEVLMVEDDPDVAQSLSFLLEDLGYHARHAGTGEQAVELVRGTAPELVLIDIGLPDQSGFEVARKLRGRLRDTPLVALSGHAPNEFSEESTDLFDEYLLKPPTVGVLRKALEQADHAGA